MLEKVIFYAPNVNVGGGFVLLKSLLNSWPEDDEIILFLDARIVDRVTLPKNAQVKWVKNTLASRIIGERQLSKISTLGNIVFCFHGLPPVFPNKGSVVVFLQNRNYLGLNPLSGFDFKTRVRLFIERKICFFYRKRVNRFIVQTESMKRELIKWFGESEKLLLPIIDKYPFVDAISIDNSLKVVKKWDFIYIADGVSHKNHLKLLGAWKILASEGIFPSLALTLGEKDKFLWNRVEADTTDFSLKLVNLGEVEHNQLISELASSNALIFPSTSESFGLPLIEAKALSIDIVASELDFVRDVCVPIESFDPYSEVSIARAVKRYLKFSNEPLKLNTSKDFWKHLLRN
ncbi:glycosyltransferase [Aliikangiella sp. IMCC44632]